MAKRSAPVQQPHPDSPFAKTAEELAQEREQPSLEAPPTPELAKAHNHLTAAGTPLDAANAAVDAHEAANAGDAMTLDAVAHLDAPDTALQAAHAAIDAHEAATTVETGDTATAPPSVFEQVTGRSPQAAAQVLGQALVEQARNAQDVEATERTLNGAAAGAAPAPKPRAPRTGHLPFGDTRFNADNAIKVIADKTAEIEELKQEWEHRKSLTADAKKAYDQAVESLLKIIDRYRDEQLRQARQPTLRDADEGEGLSTAPAATCQWEADHPGQRCPICRPRHAGTGEAPANDSPNHPQHPSHGLVAETARLEELAALAERLQTKRLVVDPTADLAALSAEDLQTLREYSVAEHCPVPPELLTRAHIAGVVDADSGLVQCCQRCGAQLWTREGGAAPHPAESLVGLSCDGTVVAAAAVVDETPAPDVARKPSKRGTRAKSQRHDPDAERAEQVKAGKAAGAPRRGRTRAQ